MFGKDSGGHGTQEAALKCILVGCNAPISTKGMCEKHYRQEYQQRPGVKEKLEAARKKWLQKPGIRERTRKQQKEYRSTPEYKEKAREYHKRPEVKEYRRKYQNKYIQRPYVKEKIKKYIEKIRQDPIRREKHRLYAREYQRRPEVKERANERKRLYASPSIFINDFMRKFKPERFHSQTELKQTIDNYAKVTCTLGNACDIAKTIRKETKDKEWSKKIEGVKKKRIYQQAVGTQLHKIRLLQHIYFVKPEGKTANLEKEKVKQDLSSISIVLWKQFSDWMEGRPIPAEGKLYCHDLEEFLRIKTNVKLKR